MIGVVLIIGAMWNGAFAMQLIRAEQAQGAPASLIYDGELPGFEYFGVINHDLPRDAKILLVGDAKGFYYQRRVDYCVTFNHNPFFERVLSNATNREVMQWIRDRGYTHVLVHWNEVRRLSATYGFSPPVDQNTLATRLAGMKANGLDPVREFGHEAISGRYVTLYSVTQE